jgi:fumarate hydratase class I
MDAVWRIEVHDLPAFVIIDDKGNDFSAQGGQGTLLTIQHH